MRERHNVYVGMTGHDPDHRFDQHKAGIKSNKYAMKYGLRLMPEIYETQPHALWERAVHGS